MNIKDDFILKDISEGYLVGGAVRDFLLGKESYDRDITIKNAEEFSHKLAQKLDAVFITLDAENKIYRLILRDKKNYLDISELRGDNINKDLLKRDFTINAIAYDLQKSQFIDITGGREDLKKGILRQIDEQNFIDDPLRLLRAFRFIATTGFKIDDELINTIKKYKELIKEPARERIHEEIMKMFGGKWTEQALIQMLESDFLQLIFPFVEDMKKVPPNTHHHLDLIHHVIETVRQIEIQYENTENEEVKNHTNSSDFGGFPRINYIKLAGFLHDIGKYSTWTLENNGNTVWKISDGLPYPEDTGLRHRFIKHDAVGAKMVIPLLRGLKFSNKQIDYISEMIRQHIYPSSIISSPVLDNKVMMRYVRKMDKNVIDNIMLAKADRLSAQGPDVTKEMTENNINGLNKLLKFYLEVKPNLKPIPKLINGTEIMDILKINQSPQLGIIIKKLHDAQLNGDISTREEALEFIRNINP